MSLHNKFPKKVRIKLEEELLEHFKKKVREVNRIEDLN